MLREIPVRMRLREVPVQLDLQGNFADGHYFSNLSEAVKVSDAEKQSTNDRAAVSRSEGAP